MLANVFQNLVVNLAMLSRELGAPQAEAQKVVDYIASRQPEEAAFACS